MSDVSEVVDEKLLAKRARDNAYRARKRAEATTVSANQVATLGADSLLPRKKAKGGLTRKAVIERGEKRLAGLLKLHGGTPKEIEKAVQKRRAAKGQGKRSGIDERARVAKKLKLTGALTMKRSYQQRKGVAMGTEIAGGARQTVATFPAKDFARIAKLAQKEGVSFAEELRRLCAKALKG